MFPTSWSKELEPNNQLPKLNTKDGLNNGSRTRRLPHEAEPTLRDPSGFQAWGLDSTQRVANSGKDVSKSIKTGIKMSADIAPVYQSHQGPGNNDRNRNIKKVYGKKTKTSTNYVRDHL